MLISSAASKIAETSHISSFTPLSTPFIYMMLYIKSIYTMIYIIHILTHTHLYQIRVTRKIFMPFQASKPISFINGTTSRMLIVPLLWPMTFRTSCHSCSLILRMITMKLWPFNCGTEAASSGSSCTEAKPNQLRIEAKSCAQRRRSNSIDIDIFNICVYQYQYICISIYDMYHEAAFGGSAWLNGSFASTSPRLLW